jgi:PAS domain S-box-containing protein
MKAKKKTGPAIMNQDQADQFLNEMLNRKIISVEFRDMNIRKVNRDLCELFGFRPDELKGISIGVLFPEYQDKDLPSTRKLNELISGLEPGSSTGAKLKFQHRHGHIFEETIQIKSIDRDVFALEFTVENQGIGDHMLENIAQADPTMAEFVHQTPLLIRMSNDKSEFYYFSKQWLNFTGSKIKDELNGGWLNHVFPYDTKIVEDTLQAACKNKSKYDLSYRLIRFDKKERWIHESGIPLFDNDGAYIGHLVISLDISQIKDAEDLNENISEIKRVREALEKSNDQLRNLFNSANDLIQITSNKGDFLFVNKTWKEKLGYSDDDILQLNFKDILDPGVRDITLGKISEISEDNEESKIDTVLLSSTGEKVFVTGNFSCSFTDGSKKECRGIFNDVTERLKAEKAQSLYYSISNLAFNNADMDSLFIEIHKELQKIVNADNFYVALCDEKKTYIHFPYFKDEKNSDIEEISKRDFGKGLTEYAITNQKPVFFTENDLLDLQKSKRLIIHGSIPKIWLGVPLKQGGNIIGIIVVQSYKDKNAYSRKDLDILVFISRQIATAIDRQQKQIKIREQAARLQSIFESGSHMIWSVNKDLNFSSYNQNFLSFLEDNFMIDGNFSTPPKNINDINKTDYWQEKYKEAFKGNSVHFELKFKNATTDKVSWKSIVLSPIYLEEKLIEEVSGIAYDITNSKMSELALTQSEEIFRDIFESFQDVYFRCSFDGEIIMLSPSVKDLLGYKDNELIGKDITNYYLYSKKSKDLLKDLVRKKSIRDFEAALIHKDGNIVQCLCNLRLVYDSTIHSMALEGVARDITKLKETNLELKQAKEVAERSLKVKELFLANMSHEIRTPMNGIIGMIDLMEGTTITPEQKHYIQTIKKSSETLLNILNDILDLSKIEAGKMQLKLAPVKLRNTMDKIYALFAQQALAKNINLYYHLSEKLPEYVLVDETRLLQILSNLISNAIKFTEGGGSIDIDLKKARIPGQKNIIRCVVSDSGIGISPENIRKLFGIFSQIDNTTTKSYGGTGLGLAISKELARLMGGKIGVYSTLGLGSSFWFTFEAEPTEKTVVVENKIVDNDIKIEGYFDDEKPNILLVDDNGVNRQVAGEILKKSGCIVTLVENGKKAIELVASNNFDLIFMDIQMPEMDGVTATKKIKAMNLKVQPPVVAMTAYSMKEDKERFLSQGLDDYIAKPIKANDLLNKVRQWVLDEQVFDTNAVEGGEGEVLNMDTVNQLIELGGEEMVHQVFDDFLLETTEQIESSIDAEKKDDFDVIRRNLHTLKGNAGTLGVEKLSKLAEAIEKNIKNDNHKNLEEDLNLLNLTFEEFKNMFNQILKTPEDERP